MSSFDIDADHVDADTNAPAKPRAWKDVAASEAFKRLPLKERSAERARFFNEVVLPHLSEEERVSAWEEFSRETLRDVMMPTRTRTLDEPHPEEAELSINEQHIAEQPARATMTRKGGVKIAPADLSLQEPPAREADWGEVVKSLPAQFVAGTRHAAANLRRMASEESAAQREDALKPATSDPSGWGALVKPSAVERQRKKLAEDREAVARASTDAEQATRDIGLVTPRDMTTAQEALSALAASSGPTLMGLAAGILTRNVAAAMAIAGGGGAAQQAGSTYGEARGHGATHRQAGVAASIDAALEAAGEMLPLAYALKPGTPVFARIFGTIAREAGQEAATQFAQDLRAMVMENPNLTFNEVWHNVKVAALAGAGGGAVYGALGAAANARGSQPAEGEPSRTVADHDLGPQRDPAEQELREVLSAEEAQAAQARAAAQEAPPQRAAGPAEAQTPAEAADAPARSTAAERPVETPEQRAVDVSPEVIDQREPALPAASPRLAPEPRVERDGVEEGVETPAPTLPPPEALLEAMRRPETVEAIRHAIIVGRIEPGLKVEAAYATGDIATQPEAILSIAREQPAAYELIARMAMEQGAVHGGRIGPKALPAATREIHDPDVAERSRAYEQEIEQAEADSTAAAIKPGKYGQMSSGMLQLVAKKGMPQAKAAAQAEIERRSQVPEAPRLSSPDVLKSLHEMLPQYAAETKLVAPGDRRASKALDRSAKLFTAAFGKEVVLVAGPHDRATGRGLDGAVNANDPSRVYINVNSNRGWRTLLGHETLHTLKRTNPKVYAGMLRGMRGAFDFAAPGMERYQGYYQGGKFNVEELAADAFGDQMDSPAFWWQVFKASPNAKTLFHTIGMALDTLRLKLRIGERRVGYETREFIRDIEAARKAMAQAYSAWQKGEEVAPSPRMAAALQSRPKGQSLALDIEAQSEWMEREAKELGYSGVEELFRRDSEAFNRLAAHWRSEHPAEALFSRPYRERYRNKVRKYEAARSEQERRGLAKEEIGVLEALPKHLDYLKRDDGTRLFARGPVVGTVATIHEKGSGIHRSAEEGRDPIPADILTETLDDYVSDPVAVFPNPKTHPRPRNIVMLLNKLPSGAYASVVIDPDAKLKDGTPVNMIVSTHPRSDLGWRIARSKGAVAYEKQTPLGPAAIAGGAGVRADAADRKAEVAPPKGSVRKSLPARKVDEGAHEMGAHVRSRGEGDPRSIGRLADVVDTVVQNAPLLRAGVQRVKKWSVFPWREHPGIGGLYHRDRRSITMSDDHLFDLDARSQELMNLWTAHEVAHALDDSSYGPFHSEVHPAFAIGTTKDGRVAKGAVIAEALGVYDKESGVVPDVLRYPLIHWRDASKHDGFFQSELFAQLAALYTVHRPQMKRLLPRAYGLFENISKQGWGADAGVARGGGRLPAKIRQHSGLAVRRYDEDARRGDANPQASVEGREAVDTGQASATGRDGLAVPPGAQPDDLAREAQPARILGKPPSDLPDHILQYVARKGRGDVADLARAEIARRTASVDQPAHEAATSPRNNLPDPTDAQIAAGNYPKGMVRLAGLDIAIENPEGSVRKWTRPDGTAGETRLAAHYGYVKSTKDRTGEQIDVFVKPGTPLDYEGPVFVADTNKPNGRADEFKVMLGYGDAAEARKALLDNYDREWDGLHAITAFDNPGAFKRWLARGDTTKRVAEQDVGEHGGYVAMASGAQHVGFINDATQAAAASATGKVIRREDVLVPFLKALGASVYQGRIKQPNVLGLFRPRKEEVRIKRASDLETTAHEIAHLLDDRAFNGFGSDKHAPRSRPWVVGPEARTFAQELRGVSYDRTKTYEGWAEYVRLYMTQPEKARAAAPNFSRWFDQFVESSKYGPAIKDAQRGMRSWFAQDALNRARSKIGPQPDLNEHLNGVWDRFRQATVDDLHGVYRMERALKGEIAPLGAYETSRLTRASGSITEGALRYGAPYLEADGSIRWVGKGLEQILEPVSKSPEQLDNFLMYAVGKSAKELKTQGRERLFTDGEINAMLALETPEFKQAMMDYQLWNMRILDFAEKKGLINPHVRAMWRRAQYLPFHRVGTTTERNRGGVSGNWHGIKTLTGGTENIRDILGNIVGNAHMLIDATLKNEARAKIVELADKTPGGAHFLTAIPTESRPVKIDKAQIRDKLIEAAGGNPRNPPPQLEAIVDGLLANAPYLMDFLVKGQAPTGGNVMAVLKGGKPYYYEVADPILFRAVQAFNRPTQSALVKWLSIPKRIGQASIVLTPDFQIANIARDTLMGAVTSRTGFLPAIDSLRGLTARLTNDPAYKEYTANGGGFASYLVDERALRAHLDRFYSEKGFNAKTMLDAPDKFLYLIETLFDSFEVATRLGEYKRARARGVHPRHAAYLGREVSTDFAMKGDSQILGFFYDTVMFLRPAVVSMDRLYRGFAHDPNRGAIAAKSGAIALASAALYLLNRDNPEYEDLPDWERDSYWHFFVPTPSGQRVHFRYPKIWEIGALGTLAERSVERILEKEPKEFAKDFGRVIKQQFFLNVVPQAAAPLLEQATNRNAFTGRPIEPQGVKNLQPFLRAKPSTSETMRALGMATRSWPAELQVNPVRAEALLRGYLNTWSMYGLMLSDAAFFGDKLPERRLDQYPVVRRFYRQEPPLDTKHEETFYDLLEEARQLRTTMRQLRRAGDDDGADKIIEREPLARFAGALENRQRVLAAHRRRAERVRQSDLSAEEKRRQLDEIQAETNAIYKEAANHIRETMRERAMKP